MNSRFKHNAPTLVRGDDRPARPCADPLNREVFEATIDHSSGHTYTQAVAEARNICLTGCDFAARKACYRENKDGAGVIAALTLLERQGRPETVERETCGTVVAADEGGLGECVAESARAHRSSSPGMLMRST